MFFPPLAVPPLRDEHQRCESRRDSASQQGIPPELSNLMNQVLAIERIGPLRRGNFVLCTTNLRSWIAADAKHLHHTIFIKTANSVCRGAGDSHLPRSPHGLFPGAAVPTANGRAPKVREPTETPETAGDSARALELERGGTAPGDQQFCRTA